jgi:aromatic-L-amino-acid decarboxylase
MDWSTKLLGLSSAFLNSSEIGGGVIMVRTMHLSSNMHLTDMELTDSQTSASDSALTAVVAARSSYLRRHPKIRLEDLVIYTTSQTHSLGTKAGLVLGLSTRVLEVFSVDNFGLRGNTLERALAEDEQAGKKPFILSQSALLPWHSSKLIVNSCYHRHDFIRCSRPSA